MEVYTKKRRNNYSYIDEEYAWFQVSKKDISTNIKQDVYNFSVKGDNTYTVNNLAVHNCYGWQWRFFGAKYSHAFSDTSKINTSKIGGFDQLEYVIRELKENPMGRRALMSYWNPPDFDKMVLPPCHYSCQFYVEERNNERYLNCHFTMRSTDVFLGLPFNIFSYAVLTYIIAIKCNMKPGTLVYTGGDVHIYKNHIDQVEEQLTRTMRPLPKLIVNKDVEYKDFSEISITDFDVVGYFPHPPIKAPMAV
jgi:thymidylate synthase